MAWIAEDLGHFKICVTALSIVQCKKTCAIVLEEHWQREWIHYINSCYYYVHMYKKISTDQ